MWYVYREVSTEDRGMARFLFSAALLLALASNASAVILASTGGRNTSVPSDSGLATAWNYEGTFDGFLGTPIGTQTFITAQHIGGNIGDQIVYQGNTYTTDGFHDVSEPGSPSDLRIWHVTTAFPSFAPLYTGAPGSEAGKTIFMVGRGVPSSGAVVDSSSVTRGWQWNQASYDGAESWGENTVSFDSFDGSNRFFMDFDFSNPSSAPANEAGVSVFDSGGGVFIQSGGVWQLAGIIHGVQSPWSFTDQGTDPNAGFNADIYNSTGMWFYNGTNWQLSTGSPGLNDASLISAYLSDIQANAPEPTAAMLVVFGFMIFPLYRPRRTVAVRA
jgi:hypothetical protein